jgi:hypothetical protein
MEMFKNMKPKHDHPKDGGKDGKHCGFMAVGITGCLGGYAARVSLQKSILIVRNFYNYFFTSI